MDSLNIEVSHEEKTFRQKLFNEDYTKVVAISYIVCTVCETNLNWMITLKKVIMKHPILEVLLCEGCLIAQSRTNRLGVCFWCSKNSENLVSCSSCPYSLCHECIKVNFGTYGLLKIQLKEQWKCVLCKSKQIWTQRAICDAAEKFLHAIQNKKKDLAEEVDCAICMGNFDNIKTLSCSHIFHAACLQEDLQTDLLCPICHSTYIHEKTMIFE